MDKERIIVFLSILVAGVIYILALTPQIGDAYDDGRYIMLAKSIAQGEGYTRLAAPGHPLESHFPPGWPLLLSAVWIVSPHFPENAMGFKVLSVFAALALAAGVYGWMRWQGENAFARVFVTLLTLFNPLVLGYATSAFSEMAYACFSVFALWRIERYSRLRTTTWRSAILPALLAVYAFYVRTIGITLILAAIVYLWFSRERSKTLSFSALSLAGTAPWFLYTTLIARDSSNYMHQLMLKSIEQPELGTTSWRDLGIRVVLNLRAYILGGLPGAVMPSQVPMTYVNLASGLRVGKPFPVSDVLLSVLILSSVVSLVIFRRALSDWYVAFYLGVALLWPWEPTRFVVPLIPLLYGYLFHETGLFGQALLKRFAKQTQHILRSLAIGSVAVFVLLNITHQAAFAWSVHQASLPPPAWRARYRLFAWVDNHVPEGSVLAAMNDSQIYLYTERSVVRELGSLDALFDSHVEYVVLLPYGGVIARGDLSRIRFTPIYRARPDAFRRVYQDTSANIEVLQVRRERLRP